MSVKLVDPTQIPYIQMVGGVPAVDIGMMQAAVAEAKSAVELLRSGSENVTSDWGRFTAYYNGPQDTFFRGALGPVKTSIDQVRGEFTIIHKAWDEMITNIEPILKKLVDLKTQCETFVQKVNAFVPYTANPDGTKTYNSSSANSSPPVAGCFAGGHTYRVTGWSEDKDLVKQNNDLQSQIDSQIYLYKQEEIACKNSVDAAHFASSWGHSSTFVDPYPVDEAAAYRHELESDTEFQNRIKDMPAEVSNEWFSIQPDWRQQILIDVIPGIIGNLNGISGKVRDQANRKYLADTKKSLEQEGKTDSTEYKSLVAIDNGMATENRKHPDVPVQLIGLNLSDPNNVKTQVCLGDYDTAQDVVYQIGGMGTNVTSDIGKDINAAQNLYDSTSTSNGGKSVAVITWLNYTPPAADDYAGESIDNAAIVGGNQLALDVNGFDAYRAAAGDPATSVTMEAHSYGTIVVAQAFSVHNPDHAHANSAILEGSPGIPTKIAKDSTEMDIGQVYAMTGQEDSTAPLGEGTGQELRIDPTSDSFKAFVLSAEADSYGDKGITDHGPIDNPTNDLNSTKNSYWDPHTTAQRNVTAVVNGDIMHLIPAKNSSGADGWNWVDHYLDPIGQGLEHTDSGHTGIEEVQNGVEDAIKETQNTLSQPLPQVKPNPRGLPRMGGLPQ